MGSKHRLTVQFNLKLMQHFNVHIHAHLTQTQYQAPTANKYIKTTCTQLVTEPTQTCFEVWVPGRTSTPSTSFAIHLWKSLVERLTQTALHWNSPAHRLAQLVFLLHPHEKVSFSCSRCAFQIRGYSFRQVMTLIVTSHLKHPFSWDGSIINNFKLNLYLHCTWKNLINPKFVPVCILNNTSCVGRYIRTLHLSIGMYPSNYIGHLWCGKM